jgi:hypothetical protein
VRRSRTWALPYHDAALRCPPSPTQDASDGWRSDRRGLLVFGPPIVSRYATTPTKWVADDGPPAI